MNWQNLDTFPSFPPTCACCLAPTDATLEVLSQLRVSGSMMRPVDRPWLVPYCPHCQAHVNLAEERGGRFFRKPAIVIVFCMLPFLPLEVVRWVALVLGGSTLAVLYGIARLRMRSVQSGPSCAAVSLAVLRKGPAGDRYAIKILNAGFARAFEAFRAGAPNEAQPTT